MKRKPSGTVSAKALLAKIKEARAAITEADNQLGEMWQRREALEVRLHTFQELLRDLKPGDVEAETELAPANLTDAALMFIQQHPGATTSDVVKALLALPSKAKD